MARKKNKVIALRNTIITFFTVVVILILGVGTYVSTGGSGGEITADEDYRVIENARALRPDDKIVVKEFFSYACIHCKTFDPVISDWHEDQADDVELELVPANFSPIWALLAQSYYALENADALDQNHARIFRALHDAGRQFLTPEMVGDYVDGRGLSAEEFVKSFNSPTVRRNLRRAEQEQLKFGVAATPTLVVADKYVLGMQGGQGRAIEVLNYLVEKVREEQQAQQN